MINSLVWRGVVDEVALKGRMFELNCERSNAADGLSCGIHVT